MIFFFMFRKRLRDWGIARTERIDVEGECHALGRRARFRIPLMLGKAHMRLGERLHNVYGILGKVLNLVLHLFPLHRQR